MIYSVKRKNKIKKKQIFGIEYDENIYGLATTDMLIHGDGNSNKVSNKMIYDAKIIGLTRPRDELYDAINKRVDEMMEEGLEEEARYFYDRKIFSKAIKTAIAYKELYMYFDKKISKEG